jgi:hypothetical protein
MERGLKQQRYGDLSFLLFEITCYENAYANFKSYQNLSWPPFGYDKSYLSDIAVLLFPLYQIKQGNFFPAPPGICKYMLGILNCLCQCR